MKIISRQEIYNGRIIKVVKDHVELQNGIKTVREAVFHKDAAAVVAVDENNEILLVTQYRYPIGRDMLELPAGLVDEGEEPLDAATGTYGGNRVQGRQMETAGQHLCLPRRT